ncbi:hypothetical protein SAMN05444064_104239 [Pseudomonas syringae]|uniref:hypothetical protein n=1 Tax=Pseudomonas syringae TaxID=317 RepID=UPI000894888E|nr:hypothetical protein [Pseudomonas syringae]SDW54580.1 hypothetical protein SAMN05444514_104240 [Pseudomonas syringae]SFL79095.1 hypothetical protein SAMN05444064_104239 [Pseudomonas syringae]
MNTLTRILGCLALASLASCAQPTTEKQPSGRADPVRRIYFEERTDGSGSRCDFEAKTVTVSMDGDPYGCEDDEMRFLKLDNVRSAVLITLRSRKCGQDGGWEVTLRTIIDPISTDWINIHTLKSAQVGSILVRGVLLEAAYDDGDSTQGKLTCVIVTASPQP